jgi:hypothetical protein
MIVAVPVSFGIALFSQTVAPWLRRREAAIGAGGDSVYRPGMWTCSCSCRYFPAFNRSWAPHDATVAWQAVQGPPSVWHLAASIIWRS